MGLMHFDRRMTMTNPTIFGHIRSKLVDKVIQYVINSDYRKAVNLKRWIYDQVQNPAQNVLDAVAQIRTIADDNDAQIIEILRWIYANTKYKGDLSIWKMLEYWQTAEETIKLGTGDCEDGSVLLYVLARLKGISEDRLYMATGDVLDPTTQKDGGHCWVAYRPTEYPLNFVFLDWCYYYEPGNAAKRNKFGIYGKSIEEYKELPGYSYSVEKSNYHQMWFCFNELHSHTDITPLIV
jgi:hypothetical protein